MKRLPIFFILAIFALTGCSTTQIGTPVADLIHLKQDTSAYHGLQPDTPLISAKMQQAAFADFIEKHFAPWHRTQPKHTAENVFWGLTQFTDKSLYGENTLLRDPAWLSTMQKRSRVHAYPSLNRRAITVVNTSMRVLPTHRPVFYDFSQAGEGFPFDYMQNSLVLAGTPLYASHISSDRAWVLVESRFAYGWVPVTDIGWVDDQFVTTFQTGAYGTVTRDDIAIIDSDGLYRFTGHVGTILPIMEGGSGNNGLACIIPARTRSGDAMLQFTVLPTSVAQQAPVPATPANFSRVANAMLGREYGWGGLYEDRDCSAATMDLMATFGIYLPRNSSQQIQVGTQISLKGMSRDQKKSLITKTATPFLTLVRKPGHIMLYIGQQDGQPLVFHSVWGLKTKNKSTYGRKVIGRAVITTLEPGIERADLAKPEGIILETVYAISTLP